MTICRTVRVSCVANGDGGTESVDDGLLSVQVNQVLYTRQLCLDGKNSGGYLARIFRVYDARNSLQGTELAGESAKFP